MTLFRDLFFLWPKLWPCVLVMWLSAGTVSLADEPLDVAITGSGQARGEESAGFYEQLLKLSLEKTRASDGDFVITHNNHGGGIARDRAILIAGAGIDVMWASATRERQQQMRMVPVDLLKNLNNYRVLLINKDDQSTFAHVKTLGDLKKFKVGSGEHWTDGIIFKDNGFNVALTSSYTGLFKMLAARRFQFISRGLHEIGFDTEEYKEFGLIQEQTLLLKYDVPIGYCFFVNKNNIQLADRIERGLRIAQQDGSFDQLFYQVSSFKQGAELLKESHRRVLELKNTKI